MRKLMMVVALVAVIVPLAGVAAFAGGKAIQCRGMPCHGTDNDDLILERIGVGKDDLILARGGNDAIRANKYDQDIDRGRGGRGNDRINVVDGDVSDTANGGQGQDFCIVDVRGEVGKGCERVSVR